MNRKINMFTLMIFAYSIVICATFKKGESNNPFSTAKANVQQAVKKNHTSNLHSDKITASVTPVTNVNQ